MLQRPNQHASGKVSICFSAKKNGDALELQSKLCAGIGFIAKLLATMKRFNATQHQQNGIGFSAIVFGDEPALCDD